MRSIKKNGITITLISYLLFGLLLIPAGIRAQVDTAYLSDTLPPAFEETPSQETTPLLPPPGENQTSNFLKKWESPADSSVVMRKIPDSLVRKMQGEGDFWYANAEVKEDNPKDQKTGYIPLGRQQWFQTLLWLLIIGGFAAALVWYLAGSNVGLFRRKDTDLYAAGEAEGETRDIFSINYQKEIDQAEKKGNYRLAIRLHFLRLLKDMTEKKIIQYKQDRTNLDYLLQLHTTIYYPSFFRITRNYEYCWYGKFEIGEDAYRIIRNDFIQLDRQLR